MKKVLNPSPIYKKASLLKTGICIIFPVTSSIFFTLFFVFAQQTFAQQEKIDSLLSVLQTSKTDTGRVKLFHSISLEYLFTNADKAIEYAKQGLTLSERIEFKEGQSNCLNSLGRVYLSIGKLDSAMICFEKRYEIVQELKDSIGIAVIYLNMGIISSNYGDNKKAIGLYEKANRIFSSHNEQNLLAKGYNNIGTIYLKQAEYQIALEYYLKVYKIYEDEKNEKDIGMTMTNISSIYIGLKQYDKARQFALNAKAKYAKANNLQGVGEALYVLSTGYSREGNFENTVKYLNEAKAIFKETQAAFYQAAVTQALGATYYEHGKIEEALNYYHSALPIALKTGDSRLISTLYTNIGEAYSDKGDFIQALEYLQKAKEILIAINDKQSLLETLKNYVKIYSQTNQPDSVKRYFLKYQQLQDTILNQQIIQSIAEMQTKYETEKKDKEILTLNMETQKKRNTIWAISSGFIVLLLFSGSGFVLSRNKKKREKEVFLRTISETDMKALRSQMNPHFIFNCIHTIKGLLSELKIQESKTCLDKFSYLTRSVLENSKKREIPLLDELETLRLYIDLENMRFSSPFQYIFLIEPSIDPETTLIPPLILQPFVENSIKHGFRDTKKTGLLKIEIRTQNETLICSIEDNGVGRTSMVNIKTSSGFKKESLGIKLTEERLDLISKTKKVKSHFLINDLVDGNNNPIGTLVEMYLPLELSI